MNFWSKLPCTTLPKFDQFVTKFCKITNGKFSFRQKLQQKKDDWNIIGWNWNCSWSITIFDRCLRRNEQSIAKIYEEIFDSLTLCHNKLRLTFWWKSVRHNFSDEFFNFNISIGKQFWRTLVTDFLTDSTIVTGFTTDSLVAKKMLGMVHYKNHDGQILSECENSVANLENSLKKVWPSH